MNRGSKIITNPHVVKDMQINSREKRQPIIQEDPNRVKFNESTKPTYFPTTASPLFPGYYRQFRGEYIIPFRGWNSLESLIPTCLHKGPIQPMHTLCTTYISRITKAPVQIRIGGTYRWVGSIAGIVARLVNFRQFASKELSWENEGCERRIVNEI